MTAKEPTFFDIRNRILAWGKLSIQAKTIWISLCQYSWAGGSCYVSRNTLAGRHGMSLPAVKRARKELTDKQLISVFKRPIPQTAVIFPFIQFEDINQRCSNVVNLSNSMGSKMTLLANNNIKDLETDGVENEPIMGSKMTLSMGSNSSPIKENSLKENIKEEKDNTTNVVFCQTCHRNDKSDTINPDSETPNNKTKLTRKQRAEKHRESREAQTAEIEANLQQYRDEYPAINIDLQLQKMRLWLDTNPKGKTRKNIHRTWANWLLKAQSNYNVAQVGKQTPENKRLSQYEEYKKYVAKNNNR